MTLDVLIATYRHEGIQRVAQMTLPQVDGVAYRVSWQLHEGAEIPDSLKERPDVIVSRFDGQGVSANRNNLLELSEADACLMADDDLHFCREGLLELMATLEGNPAVDVALCRFESPEQKHYPSEACSLKRLPKGFTVSTPEIAVNRRGDGAKLRFNPDFGPGGRFQVGEDEIFVLDARSRGLNVWFFPITLCSHPHSTTGTRPVATTAGQQGVGAVIARLYPWSWPLRVPLKAFRSWRSGRMGLLRGFANMSLGALKSLWL